MKTNTFNRKLIALLLSIVTIIGCFSGTTAFAEELDTNIEEPIVSSVISVPSHEVNFGKGGGGMAISNIPVYYDYTLTGSYQIGTLSTGTGFTILADDSNVSTHQCLKVEYNTTSGPQQGYIPKSLSNFYWTTQSKKGLAHVQVSSSTVYYGAEPGYYQAFGTVYYGEFVAVLGISNSNGRAFIEYNAANGYRKRGYVDEDDLYYYNGGTTYSTPFDLTGTSEPKPYQPVYSGPSTKYPIIGYIGSPNSNEAVNHLIDTSVNGNWKYITYAVTGTSYYKAGYILN